MNATVEQVAQAEHRSLRVGMWAMLLFAVGGFAAYILSGAAALALDGYYSLINVATAFIAGRLVVTVAKAPDRDTPYGRSALENLYVLFRSLVLLGIISVALLESILHIVQYFEGEHAEIPNFGVVVTYCMVSTAGMVAIALMHRRNNAKVGGASSLLTVEGKAAVIDATIAGGVGVTLGLVALIPNGTFITSDTFNIKYIADSVVVLILASLLLSEPIHLLRTEFGRLSGRRMDPDLEARITAAVADVIAARGVADSFAITDVFAIQRGKSFEADIRVSYEGTATVDELDEIRTEALKDLSAQLGTFIGHISFTRKLIHESFGR